jgi:hypothetical protein
MGQISSYFVDEITGEVDEPPVERFEGLRKLEKSIRSRSGIFWGVHAHDGNSRFANWEFENSVDSDEQAAKRNKFATKLLLAFTTYVETNSKLMQIRQAIAKHPENEDLKTAESELVKALAEIEKESSNTTSWIGTVTNMFSAGSRDAKNFLDALHTARKLLGFGSSDNNKDSS